MYGTQGPTRNGAKESTCTSNSSISTEIHNLSAAYYKMNMRSIEKAVHQ